jgi:N-acetyl sugar amidotransferase
MSLGHDSLASTPERAAAADPRACARCIMNAKVDPSLAFDEHGVCHHCREYDALLRDPEYAPATRDANLAQKVAAVKARTKNRPYDVVLGISGGVDSSYGAWFAARKLGLRPLIVHMDNGWNSELAVLNIERVIRGLGVDLYTHVIDWEEFRDLQRSLFKASVVDIEMLTDHAIIATLYAVARKFRVPTIMTGENFATEATLPKGWNHRKTDLVNILAMQWKFGTRRTPTFPKLGTPELFFFQRVLGIQWFRPLFYTHFDKAEATSVLQNEFGWRPYGGKHYESIFTRFYQGHFLPKKFGIDKRYFYLSRLVTSGQLPRSDALRELAKPPLDPEQERQDVDFCLKKLGFSAPEWEEILATPPRSHYEYWSDERILQALFAVNRGLRTVRRAVVAGGS